MEREREEVMSEAQWDALRCGDTVRSKTSGNKYIVHHLKVIKCVEGLCARKDCGYTTV